jgi:beta-glucosidase
MLVMASALVLVLLAWLVVAVGPARAAATLLSQGKAATASSVENAGTPAGAAVDGNTGTRWSSAAGDPQWLQVDLGSTATISQVVLQWEAAYATAFQIQVSADASTWTTIYSTTTGTGGTQTLNISGSGRYVRMYGTARATGYGYSLWEFQVYGSLATGGGCGTSNAALTKPATTSSTENAGTPASAAVDGNAGTRWSSAASDPQWLQVDLGSTVTVCQVVLQWETAYATAFQIQVSANASTWTTIYSTTAGTGGTQTLTVSGSGRYIRMYGTARATPYGYSLWEFAVNTTGAEPEPEPVRESEPQPEHQSDRRSRSDRVLRLPGPCPGPADHGVLDLLPHGQPGLRGHRRQPRQPLGKCLQRPAVA